MTGFIRQPADRLGDHRVRSLLFVLLGSFPIVPETKQAVVVRFGKPVRILNRYQAGPADRHRRAPASRGASRSSSRSCGSTSACQDVDMQPQQVLSTDQRRLEVDAFARYRIVDPLLMYIRAGTEEQLREPAPADPRLGSPQRARQAAVRRAADARAAGHHGRRPQRRSNRIARQYGVEIIDVRIKRTDLPDGAPLAVRVRPHAHRAAAGSALDPRAGREAGADHPRRRPMPRPRRPMPRASARTPISTISIAPCRAIRRRSSATARTSPRRRPSFCRRRTTI